MSRHYLFSNKTSLMRTLKQPRGIYTGRCHAIGGEYKETRTYFPISYNYLDKTEDIQKKSLASEPHAIDPIPAFMRGHKKQQTGNGFDEATKRALQNPIQV